MPKKQKPDEVFRALGKRRDNWLQLTDLRLQGKSARDRARVLVDAANLDDRLQEAITHRFVALPKGVRSALFSDEYAIATFKMKTNLAYALGIFGDWALHDLNVIRTIRNGFAHYNTALTLDESSVVEMCRTLVLPDKSKPEFFMFANFGADDLAEQRESGRGRWMVSVWALTTILALDVIRNDVSPKLPANSWDDWARSDHREKDPLDPT